MVSILEARDLLGSEAESMTDEQIQRSINICMALAERIVNEFTAV